MKPLSCPRISSRVPLCDTLIRPYLASLCLPAYIIDRTLYSARIKPLPALNLIPPHRLSQMLAMLYYLSSFVPGGTKGVEVLLKMGLAVLRTALAPCLFVAKTSAQGLFRTLTS